MGSAALCVAAIYRRDARVAMTRPLGFAARAFAVTVSMSGFYFLSKIVDPSHFSTGSRHSSYFGYVAINLAFILIQGSALQSFASGIRSDQVIGALEPIIATQRRAWPYILASGMWPLSLSTAEVTLSLSVATLLGLDLHHTNVVTLLMFIALSTLTMGSLGVLSAAGVIAFKQIPPANYLIGGAAPLLAGALFPTTLLPKPLQVLSWLLPLTHSLRGLRGAVSGAPPRELAADALWLGVATLILLPIAFYVLDYTIDRGRRDGTLSQY